MRYLPQTDEDVARLLKACGKKTIDDLFASIPARLRLKRPLAVGEPMDEAALDAHLGALSVRNSTVGPGGCLLSFLGAGVVPHVVPSAVDALLQRAELYTVYTPYQPEISQGTLQAIFEFQTIVAEVLGVDVANASMYDGASACAEAVLMARRLTGKRHVIVSAALHPEYLATTRTYTAMMDADGTRGGVPEGGGAGCQRDLGPYIHRVPVTGCGTTDDVGIQSAVAKADGDLACVVVQTPNFFGVIEDLRSIAELCRKAGALLVGVTTEPLAFALLEPPGRLGADIVAGEAIGLASAPSFGGPGLGLLGAGKDHVRQMPGRLVGETVDVEGRRGYVLTLATREQHIRREKATSNICTNHGLLALAFTIHMSLLGKRGFAALGRLNASKAAYAKERLSRLRGFSLRFPSGPIFNEIALRVPGADAQALCDRLLARGIVPGVPLGRFDEAFRDTLLVSVNETHTREQIDTLATALEEVAR